MTFGVSVDDSRLIIRKGTQGDISAIKRIADQHKRELGFIVQGALKTSVDKGELFVATWDDIVCGFVQYRHRRDHQTTLYNIVISEDYRGRGIGRKLIYALIDEATVREKQLIYLKCPSDLPSNEFYRNCGFILDSTESGKFRALNIWRYSLQ